MSTDEGTPSARRRWWRRPAVLVSAGAVIVVAAVAGMAAFQPWKLFVDTRVDEATPTAAPPVPAASAGQSPAKPVPTQPVVLAKGAFISHEHETTGSVRILRLPDGQRVLRVEDLDTSNGPDLKMWLADAPVIDGRDGWFVFDDNPHVDLGPLKGNVGNQNYPIPDSVDLRQYPSVTIWCERFHVSFGAAALQPA